MTIRRSFLKFLGHFISREKKVDSLVRYFRSNALLGKIMLYWNSLLAGKVCRKSENGDFREMESNGMSTLS